MSTKVAHRPMLAPEGLDARKVAKGEGFALYMIDAARNHSKFYEGIMLPNDDGSWGVKLRWGALTDSGFTGRIDGGKFDGRYSHMTEREAKALLSTKYRQKTGKGYIDAWGSRHKTPDGKALPKGQYPIGLKRDVGFGWGVQEAAFCIPDLRVILGYLETAKAALGRMQFSDAQEALLDASRLADTSLRGVDSTMSQKIKDNIAHMLGRAQAVLAGDIDTKAIRNWNTAISRLMSYLNKQLSVCHGKVADAISAHNPKAVLRVASRYANAPLWSA